MAKINPELHIDIEILKTVFAYKDGHLYRIKIKKDGKVYLNPCVRKDRSGYIVTSFKGKSLRAHRVVWALVYGEWPEIIDHINGITFDNRISNLRSVSYVENAQNQTIHRSGQPLAVRLNKNKKWGVKLPRSLVEPLGLPRYAGSYDTKEDAIRVVELAIRWAGMGGPTILIGQPANPQERKR